MKNKESLLQYMESVHSGIKGEVIDAETGNYVQNARVKIRGNGKVFFKHIFSRSKPVILKRYFYRLYAQREMGSFGACQFPVNMSLQFLPMAMRPANLYKFLLGATTWYTIRQFLIASDDCTYKLICNAFKNISNKVGVHQIENT